MSEVKRHSAAEAVAEAPSQTVDRTQLLKLAIEFGPLVVFFIANARAGIFWGTAAFMVAIVISLFAARAYMGRIPVMPLISGAFVLTFGGLTLWLQDEVFIKTKPTIVNLLFAAILVTGVLLRRNFLKVAFGDVLQLTDEGWRKLTIRWVGFFVALAALNELVWRNFSTDFWVSFKVFGIMPLTFLFAMAQIGLLKKYEDTTKEP